MRVLLLATTTGYQTRAFGNAAERLGIELAFATDRCHQIDDPWQDAAIPIRFYEEEASVSTIVEAARTRPIDGIVAVGDRPTVIAARAAVALGLPWHAPDATRAAGNKVLTRECLRDANLPVPWFDTIRLDGLLRGQTPYKFPCVIKPIALSGSRGVMRADDPISLESALDRLRALMRWPDIRAERNAAHDTAIVEGFVPGREYAVDALLHHGVLHVLAIFAKPDPLDGPFFEETIYLTPPDVTPDTQRAIVAAVDAAAAALGLSHGPIHAECRVNDTAVVVLEVAARTIGGLCARALRFDRAVHGGRPSTPISLEELLLRQAVGESPAGWTRERDASGVMMIPIPRRGLLRGVEGVDEARQVAHVADVRITAKMDQLLVPLPEGASYLGFMFARAAGAPDVERALRAAHARLRFLIDTEFPLLAPGQIHYNLEHG